MVLSRFSPAAFCVVTATLAAVILAVVWAFQLIGGYAPCALCYEQRWGYYLAVPMLLTAAFMLQKDSNPMIAKLLILLSLIGFVHSAGIGIYQAGAEWELWPGPASCSLVSQAEDTGDLLSAMRGTKIASCTAPSIRILGLSFAGLNAISASLLAMMTLLILIYARHDRNQKD